MNLCNPHSTPWDGSRASFYSTIPAFWLLIHTRIEYWRSRRRSPYRVLIPVWIGMWVLLALITLPWRTASLYQYPWTWFPAAALFAVGLWLYRESGVSFSKRQLYGLAELKVQNAEQLLVTTGIRARVRHPVYLAHLCEMLAWSVATGLAVCYALTAFGMITGAIMIRMEDAELTQRFGEPFAAYKKSVPAVLPKFAEPHSRL
jgi:protein-S-isoprenylcysteine O-methyltransferase Ste14